MGGLIQKLPLVGLRESQRKPWVKNRVVLLREVLSCDSWSHVVSGDNPADIPTRLNYFERLAGSMWFYGPEFLCCNPFVLSRFDVDRKLKLAEVVGESKRGCEFVADVVETGDEIMRKNV